MIDINTFANYEDVDGRVIMGRHNYVHNGNATDTAYIMMQQGETWLEEAQLLASDGRAGDEFGYSVVVWGEMAVVAAPKYDTDKLTNAGAVYLFTRSGITWTQALTLTAYDADTNDEFGYSVALQEDTLVIGSRHDDDNGFSSGSVYIYTRTNGIWNSTPLKFTPADGAAYDYFGNSLAYDPIYRLTHSTYSGAVQANYHYTYDAVGNMSAFTETVETNITRVDRTFNAANQLQTSFDYEEGTTSFTFDANSNLT